MITIKLLVWLCPIIVNIYLDRLGDKRNYIQVNIIRGIFAIIHGAWLLPKTYNYSYASSLDLLLVWMPILIFQLTSYWVFFELGLNAVRGNPLLYYDHQESDSGYIDRLFKWAGPVWHGIVKVLCLIIMTLSIITIYENY